MLAYWHLLKLWLLSHDCIVAAYLPKAVKKVRTCVLLVAEACWASGHL